MTKTAPRYDSSRTKETTMLITVFGLIVLVMIIGGVLLSRLATLAKSKGSWVWGFFILILLICVPLLLLGMGALFLFVNDVNLPSFPTGN